MSAVAVRTVASPAMPSSGETARVYDRAYANRAMAILAVLVVLVMYVEGMLTPSLPSIATEFGVSISQVSLVLSVYLVSGTAINPIVGKLGDIYGKKKVLSYLVIAYTAAVTVTGFSPSFAFMVASRAVQGVGLGVLPLGMTLVREEFPRELVPRAQGLLSAMFGVGAAVSIPVGAWVSNAYGWRTTYHSAIPFAVVIAALVIYLLRESVYRRPDSRVDYFGAVGLAAALACIVLALSLGPTWGWTDAKTVGLLLVGGAALVPVYAFERRQPDPVLNLRLLRERNVQVTNMAMIVAGFGMFLAMQALAFRFESPSPSGFGYSIFDTGLAFMPFMLAQLVFGPVSGVLVSRIGAKPLGYAGAAVGAVGFFACSLGSTPTQLLAAEFLAGSGLAIMMASVINLLILTVDPRELSLGTAMNAVFRTMGSSLGAPIAGTIMSTFTIAIVVGHAGPIPIFYPFAAPVAYAYVFYIAAAAFVAAGLVTVFGAEVLGRRAPAVAPAPLPRAKPG